MHCLWWDFAYVIGALIMYQQLPNDFMGQEAQCIKRLADNAFIPFDDRNVDYVEFQAWVAEGNTPQPADQGEAE